MFENLRKVANAFPETRLGKPIDAAKFTAVVPAFFALNNLALKSDFAPLLQQERPSLSPSQEGAALIMGIAIVIAAGVAGLVEILFFNDRK